MSNALHFCEVCQGYSVPEAVVDIRNNSTNSCFVVVSEEELGRLYEVEKRYSKLGDIGTDDSRRWEDYYAQLEDRFESQRLLEANSQLTERLEIMSRQITDANVQFQYRVEHLEERLASVESQNRQMAAEKRQLRMENPVQRTQIMSVSEGEDGSTVEVDRTLLMQQIKRLGDRINEDALKIQQMEMIIDMLNRRLEEKDRTYHRLMVKHKTLMKEE